MNTVTYEKVKNHYSTRNNIKNFSIVILVIDIIIMFINTDMGANLLTSLFVCLFIYLIGSFLIMLPLRMKPEFKEYKVMAKDEIKQQNQELVEASKNKQAIPKQQFTKGSIVFFICVIVSAIIPKDYTPTTVQNTDISSKSSKSTSQTKQIAKDLNSAISKTPWGGMVLKPTSQAPNNYNAYLIRNNVERNISIIDLESSISLTLSTSGNADYSEEIFTQFINALMIVVLNNSDKDASLTSAMSNISIYVDEFITSRSIDNNGNIVMPSLEKKIDDNSYLLLNGSSFGDELNFTISYNETIQINSNN